MTPKEKAKELVNKYFSEMQFSEFVNDLDASKQCTLIAVDEIIKALDYLFGTTKEVTYWREVKQEIEKL